VTSTTRRSLAAAALAAVAVGAALLPPPTAAAVQERPDRAYPGAPAAVRASLDTATAPCGWRSSGPARYRTVVWVWLENHSRDQVVGAPGSAVARRHPALASLARACGLATNYRAVSHPSLPNYLSAASGTTFGVRATCSPASCPRSGATLFSLAQRSGRSWRTYAEAMPAPCATTDAGRYAVRHNVAAYFTDQRASCRLRSVPMGSPARGDLSRRLAAGTLPGFVWLVPDLCHSGHDCSSATADAWLGTWLPRLLRSKQYRAGTMALVVTFDEGAGGYGGQDCRPAPDASCRVATVVASPSTRPGARSVLRFDHYSLLRTTEELLGLSPLLGRAAGARSMRLAFGL
jgi:hypothetical protein